MGNNPSSNQQTNNNNNSRSNPTSSAPATPTGTHHLNHHSSPTSSPLNPQQQQQQQQQQHQQLSSSSTSSSSINQIINLLPTTTTFVDGGYLFPLSNIYPSSPQDWLHPVVQHLILSRRLAPFYRGLEDWEEDWDRQMTAHALQSITLARTNAIKQIQKLERQESIELANSNNNHNKPNSSAGSISRRFTKNLLIDHPPNNSSQPFHLFQHNHQTDQQSSSNNNLRQQIFAAILNSQIRPNEIDQYLPQTIECPICFLYYPTNINLSRCCQQPICTECFTQIKRTDPTPQEIKSEPACCPYCVESNFGVTYEPPPPHKRTDWSSSGPPTTNPTDTLAVPVPKSQESPSSTTIASQSAPNPSGMMVVANLKDEPGQMTNVAPSELGSTKMKRRQTTSHTSKEVVTTDSIQPDWQAKLEAVKAAVQRRANRRIIFRQEGDRLIPVGITSSRDPNGSAFLAAFEQQEQTSTTSTVSRRGLSSLIGGGASTHSGSFQGNPTGTGSVRRNRTENSNFGVDLEELMIMEAMRLSLAEEEERKRKAAEEEDKFKKITQAITDEQTPPVGSSTNTLDQNKTHSTPTSTPAPTSRLLSKPNPESPQTLVSQGPVQGASTTIDHQLISSPSSFAPDPGSETDPINRHTQSSLPSSSNPFLTSIHPDLIQPSSSTLHHPQSDLLPLSSPSPSSASPVHQTPLDHPHPSSRHNPFLSSPHSPSNQPLPNPSSLASSPTINPSSSDILLPSSSDPSFPVNPHQPS